MTYKEWAGQYYRSAERIRRQIDELKQEMKTAVGETMQELCGRMNMLNAMYRDCITIADMLVVRSGEI